MAYGILKFKLPEEREDFEHAQNGIKYLCAIEEFSNHLRSLIKYEQMSEAEHNKVCEIREKFFEIFEGLV